MVQTPRSTMEWYVAFFQIYVGLYALQKYFDFTHHDMHWGNVLVHKTSKGGYAVYTIDNNTYYIPILGYEFVIWDFGYGRIPEKIELSSLNEANYYKDPLQNPRLICDYARITEAINWTQTEHKIQVPLEISKEFYLSVIRCIERGFTLKQLIPYMYSKSFSHKPNGETQIFLKDFP